jgi:hypothetical protein
LKVADFAFFAAVFWPQAAWEELLVLTYFATWSFLWDDEIDMAIGDLASNFEAAQLFRKETLLFIEHSLGLAKGAVAPQPPNPIINCFQSVADALRKAYTTGKKCKKFDSPLSTRERRKRTRY